MACPVYQSFAEGKCEEATSVVVNKPSGVVEGDLMIAFCSTDGYTETHTAPSASWNKIIKDVENGGSTFSIWYKIAGASEGASYTFSNDSNEEFYAWIIRITGHSTTSPIHKISFQNVGTDSTISCPDLITDHDDCLIIRAISADDGDINIDSGWSAGTNITVDKSSTSSGECVGGACHANKATAGAVGAVTLSMTAAEQNTGITIAIRSSSSGWVTPLGFVDSGSEWDDEEEAFDGAAVPGSSTSTNLSATTWSSYLELEVPEVTNCTKVRFYAGNFGSHLNIDIDLYYNSQWNNLYEGSYVDQEWVEKAIGSTQAVTAMRIRFYNTHTSAVLIEVNEAHFWDVGDSGTDLNSTSAIVFSITGALSRGAAEALSSTSDMSTSTTGVLSRGITQVLTSASNIINSITGALSRGVAEALNSTANIGTLFTAILTKTGIVLTSTANLVSSFTGTLSRGVGEALASTSNLSTSIASILSRGKTQVLASTSALGTLFTAILTEAGGVIDLISTSALATSITSSLSRGITETLSSTSSVVTSITSRLTRIMDLVSVSSIASSITSSLSRGITAGLVSTSGMVTSITSTLSRGIAQVLTSASTLATSIVGVLSRGVTETLSSTADIATSITGSLSRGIKQTLVSISNMTTSFTAILSKLLTQLNSVAAITTLFTASLSRGAAEALTSTSTITTSIAASLTRGIKQTLISTINMATSFITSLSRGTSEALTSISNIITSILAKLKSDLIWTEEIKKTCSYVEEEKKAVGSIVEEEKKTANWTKE